MYDLNSILGRALVIHNNIAKGSRWVFSNIVPTNARELSATANFSISSDLVGTIQLVSSFKVMGNLSENHFEDFFLWEVKKSFLARRWGMSDGFRLLGLNTPFQK